MDSIRKWFFRPKRDDTSLLAQFFFADEALNMIASELDSFDGRKDPERCTALVNQLRQSQDKVLTITNSIMDDLIGDERANRNFRVKFPEDVLQENLAGQLWFGAECLAAGSSIMNREAESMAMRPLAKALTKSLEHVRSLLRDVCLTNNTPNGPIKLNQDENVTDMLLESLKIFDRHFAEFELCYVSAMVPVKTAQEFELQELICVLFSETLQRALRMSLLTQDMVDDCDPALMFTIPRLAIVSGLLIFPNGPLCIDKPVDEMSEMFRPFRTLLLRIRELLWTLDSNELYTLEKLLCDNEHDAHLVVLETPSDEFVHKFYADVVGTKELLATSLANSPAHVVAAVLPFETRHPGVKSETVNIPSTSSGYLITNTVDHDAIMACIPHKRETIVRAESLPDSDSLQVINHAAATLTSILNTKDASGCKLESPDDSGVCTENTSLDRSPSLDGCCAFGGKQERRKCSPSGSSRQVRKGSKRKEEETVSRDKEDEDAYSVSSTDTTSSFSSTCVDDEELALAMQAAEIINRCELRAKFSSIEDLIHRLYVCISGVSDQLQTNFASDMRNILQSLFLMNASSEAPPPPPKEDPPTIEYQPAENDVIESNVEFSVDPNLLAQEALFDSNVYFQGVVDETPVNTEEEERNVTNVTNDLTRLAVEDQPTAAREEVTRRAEPERPPIWIPDEVAPKCMSCGSNFTVVKRRHHCRNCGKVFCARCSSNSVPLPKFGFSKPVRVCNKCFIYHLAPFTM
ncbi:lateral signaling target protein 2 homolog [Atheta coriaria]|uniref:lateral signaling target protein 2 homolog n=1 Tax=Dalotia coriaria TaxID=877792 RepID=UPI0031F389B1